MQIIALLHPRSGAAAARGILAPLLRKQRITAAKQRAVPLFYCSPHRPKPRISAEKGMSCADNLRQKQQKQREPSPPPSILHIPMNASDELERLHSSENFCRIFFAI